MPYLLFLSFPFNNNRRDEMVRAQTRQVHNFQISQAVAVVYSILTNIWP